MYWPNSLDCTDLNQCGARRDAELCRLCYKQKSIAKKSWVYNQNSIHHTSELDSVKVSTCNLRPVYQGSNPFTSTSQFQLFLSILLNDLFKIGFFRSATLGSKSDSLDSPISCVVIGKPFSCGTGSFKVMQDLLS